MSKEIFTTLVIILIAAFLVVLINFIILPKFLRKSYNELQIDNTTQLRDDIIATNVMIGNVHDFILNCHNNECDMDFQLISQGIVTVYSYPSTIFTIRNISEDKRTVVINGNVHNIKLGGTLYYTVPFNSISK